MISSYLEITHGATPQPDLLKVPINIRLLEEFFWAFIKRERKGI